MKAPITAFLLSLGISLNLNLNNHVSSSEIELDSSSGTRIQIDLELDLDLDLDSTKPSRSSFTPPDEHTYHKVKSSRARRMAEQRDRVREKIASGEFAEKYHRITEEQLINLVDNAYEEDPDLNKAENQWIRRGNLKESLNDPRRRDLWLWGIIQRDIRDPYEIDSGEADISADWDKWAQGYRHIGDFVDCSDMFGRGGGGSHDSGSGDRAHKCNRWAAWCAYVDPYYAGGGYDEYFGNDAKGKLDCHVPSTKWLLLGCYAQELYQWYEQISKHLWAIDDYNYVVAVAGLAYMTDENCKGPYYDTYNNEVYFGVMPLESGKIMMGAYSDDQCIYPNEKTTATYDDFFEGGGGNNDNEQYQGQDYQYRDQNQNNEEYQYQGQDQDQNQNDIANEDDGGNKDQGQDQDGEARQLSEWWGNAQEYTMTLFNEVYSDYLYCTSCMDYPTYQDGYFIGDDGTDDEDLINQCWKFYSHDSFNLPVDGMAQAAMQGGLTAVAYRGAYFGTSFDGQYRSWYINDQKSRSQKAATYQKQQRIERLKANLFLTFSGIIYVATVLVFAVARGSSKKMKSSSRSRSRRLLDADYDDDGGSVDPSCSSSSRAKSSDGRSSSASKAKSSSSSNRSKSCNRKSEDGDYKAPSPDCDSDMARTRSESRSRTRNRKSSSSPSVIEIEYMYADAD